MSLSLPPSRFADRWAFPPYLTTVEPLPTAQDNEPLVPVTEHVWVLGVVVYVPGLTVTG